MDDPGDDIIAQLLPDAPGEYLLLGGRPGIGKTNLVLYLAFCLAIGNPFYGLDVKPCKVGYLAFEGSKRKLNERLEKVTRSFPDPVDNLLVEVATPYRLLKAKTGKHFIDTILGLKVVIIDPLRYFAPYAEVKDAANFISEFKQILKAAGVVGVINHHVRKRDRRYRIRPENFIDELKGATDFVDSAQSVLLLEKGLQPRDKKGRLREVSEDDRVLYFVKTKDAIDELKPLELRFNRETLIFERIEE